MRSTKYEWLYGWYYWDSGSAIEFGNFIHFTSAIPLNKRRSTLSHYCERGPFKTLDEAKEDAIARYECTIHICRNSIKEVKKFKEHKK